MIKRMCDVLLSALIAGVLYTACGIPEAPAQNVTCATRPVTDDSNACASTAFVVDAIPYYGLIVGTTVVTGAANLDLLYNNAGVLGAWPTNKSMTGGDVPFTITNTGTLSNASTTSTFTAGLNSSAAVLMQAVGGSAPQGLFVTSTAMTGGLGVTALEGPVALAASGTSINDRITGSAWGYDFTVYGGGGTGLTGGTNLNFYNTYDGGSLNLRFYGKNTNGDQKLGALINPGLSTNTAGAEVGDIDFIIYRLGDPFTPIFCSAMTGDAGTEGYKPCTDGSYYIGGSANRWANIYGVIGTFNSITLPGSTSGGTVLLGHATGTATVTFGTSSGTPAVTASSPLAITTATGNITCATCVTSSGGGAITGVSPIAVSAAGAVSLNGTATAGQILQSVDATSTTYSTATYPATATGTGAFMRANGTNWVQSTSTLPDTAAQGDVLYASTTNVWTSLPKNTTATRYLSNTGSSNVPAWAQIDLTNGVTGALPAANVATSTSNMNTAWTSFTPSITCGAGSVTSYTNQIGAYQIVGKTMWIRGRITINLIGTCATSMTFTLPGSASVQSFQAAVGREIQNTGKMITISMLTTTGSIFFYDGTLPNANNADMIFAGSVEIQ